MNGTRSRLTRLLGGSPLAVLLKLVFLSLVVGAIMAGLGLTPGYLVYQFAEAVRSLFGLGFETIRDIWQYILTGAVIVVPIWLLTRIFDRR
jgi:predicted ABC-type sugar transport system permease subunit